jgi:hypothetical protein
VYVNDSNVAFMPAATAGKGISLTSATSSIDLSTADMFHIAATSPSFVGSATTDFSSATTGSASLPTGMQQGDYVLVFATSDGSQPTTSDTTWTVIQSTLFNNNYSTLWQKQMGATPDTTLAITGISTASVAIARAYRGVSGVATSAVSGSATGMPDAPAITPLVTNSTIVIFGGLDDDAGVTGSAPANYGNFVRVESSATKVTGYSADRFGISALEDPAIFGGAGTDDVTAITVALSPGIGQLTFTNTPSQAVTGYGTVNGSTKLFYIAAGSSATFPASVSWVAGAPTSSPALISIVTFDGGTTWIGSHAS